MKPNYVHFLMLTGLIIFSFSGCINKNHKYPESEIAKVPVEDFIIHRYDSALFSLDINDFENQIKTLVPEFGFFLTDLNPNSAAFLDLQDFVNDPVIFNTSKAVQKTFPELDELKDQLKSTFQHLKYHFPSIKIPAVYTYVSGYDAETPIIFADSILIIGLDNYLGANYPFYPRLNFPKYRIARMSREYMVRDCADQIAEFMLRETKTENRFIDRMIFEGKKMYFIDLMIPKTDDTIKTGYTLSQLEWCHEYEKNIWAFIIDSKLMYDTDQKKFMKLFNDGPYSNDFGPESAPRMGVYMGWKIVEKFMDKNPEYNLADLLKDTDSQKILTLSKYRP